MSTNQITICTIIAKNYLAYVRTLTDSFLKNNPEGKVFVLLVDDMDNKLNPEKEKFTLINIDQIGLENLEDFCFKYTVLEQNTGVKAHFLKYLFEKYNLKKLIYFDPDILFTNSLENLWKLLDKKSIVLTPHLTAPIFDEKRPSEYDIMRSGSFNLGFIALSKTETTSKFLDWWIPHLMEEGYSDVEKGMFVDQKWVDLVPSLFDDVYIIRHPGYNAAYWNLMQRSVKIIDGKITINGKPLYFFHFSGFSPENFENVSKHQNRFVLKDIESMRPLFEFYRDMLVENGYLEIKNWKCKFDYFDNGAKIPDEARRVYAEAITQGLDFGNPFSTSGSKSFINFLNENVDEKKPIVTRLWYQIYLERKDLHSQFPDPLVRDRNSFFNWVKNSVRKEYNFDKIFLPEHLIKKQNQVINEQTNQTKLVLKDKMIGKKAPISKIRSIESNGINISGYFRGLFGVAESARSFVRSVKSAGIPHVLNNVSPESQGNYDNTLTKFEKSNPYSINLVVVNADQVDVFYNTVGADYFRGKYNIAIWAWELPNFPSMWIRSQEYFDEIWVLSNFVAGSLAKSLSIPVIRMTCSIEIDETKLVKDRKKFGLSEDSFVFLYIFDFLSVFERKNPLALVEAFNKAFTSNEKVTLVLKIINGSKFPTNYAKLKKLCDKKNVILIDEHFEKDDILSLIASCDSYVSLHRSEGTGLTLAEAMYARKPVIATAYGGNTDFMNINNSFLVKYRLVELEMDYGPYKKGNFWAEPDVNHAAQLMKYVFENQNEAKNVAERGKNFIKQNMNSKVAGEEILTRLKNL